MGAHIMHHVIFLVAAVRALVMVRPVITNAGTEIS